MSAFSAYSAYYDLLYMDKDYAAEAAYVLKRITAGSGRRPGSVLELGCGTGRHAESLCRQGVKVTGVDISSTMIERARARVPEVVFVEGDVRTVRLDAKFDCVVALFHVASYQTSNEDIKAFLATAAAHLNPGGVFMFDFWYGPAVYAQKPTVRVKRMENEAARVLRTAEPVHRVNDCVVEVHYEIIVEEKATQLCRRIKEVHPMRYFFLPELVLLLDQAGFKGEDVHFEEWLSGNEPGEATWGVACIARMR